MAELREGTVALVTGGGSGIGRGIAEMLAAAGAAVAVTGRRREPLEETVAAIEEAGGRALAVEGDVARADDAARMVAETVEAFGSLHVLVNNAGIARGGPLELMTDADIEATVDVDLKGPIYVTRAALSHLRKQPGTAAVVNISSSVTVTPTKGFSVYTAAKAGLEALTRCWALDHAAEGIRVNAISPGVVDTPIFETMMPKEAVGRALDQFRKMIPAGRVGQPGDVARLALFLADPDNDWLTGTVIPLDGGLSLAGG